VFAVERSELMSCPAPESLASAHALDHVVIRTALPDAAVALYGTGLGVRLALDRELGGTRMLFFRVGGVTLEVVHDPALGAEDVLWGAAYRVRDIEAAHARMAADGRALGEIKRGQKPGTHVFSVRDGTCAVPTLFLRDPARE
jgi:catechol 2,3-dioxygenase-like lactoylglutathione lyase family enzyme